MDKKIIAIIERGQDAGFAITSSIPGLIGSGMTEEEARSDFAEVLEEQAEYYEECHGEKPWWPDSQVEYRYDLAAFFAAFPYINVSQFARTIGINPSLMRKYKQGIVCASEKQRALIQEKLAKMVHQLQLVHF